MMRGDIREDALQASPLIILQELQRGRLWASPTLMSPDLFQRLDRIRSILRLARMSGWPVAHVLHRAPDGTYDPQAPEWRPIDGFEPVCSEMVFMISDHSAFSNPRFEEMLTHSSHVPVLVSAQGQSGCTHTLRDAYERGVTLTCLSELDCIEANGDQPAVAAPARMAPDRFMERFAGSTLMLRLSQA